MHALVAATPERLVSHLGVRIEDARKIVAAVHRDEAIDGPVTGVRTVALQAVRGSYSAFSLTVAKEERSALDPFRKLLLIAADGAAIETVRIPLEKPGRFSVCVSSQVGCALACAFCATGRMGLHRNLESWEIVEQVRAVRRTLEPGERVRGVVFQGMGEPLANLDRVLEAISVLTHPCAQAIDGRAITVCTSGLPAGIRRLAVEAPRVRLGISISSAIASKRRLLMPITDSHPLEEVITACVEHAKATTLAPMWAITLLANENDDDAHADALATLAIDFAARAGVKPRISLIPYNAITDGDDDPFTRSLRMDRFREVLLARKVGSHIRYSGGSDVAAACGQLRARATV